MRLGSLFSGIGGLELGLEQAGLGHTVWQVEQDAYCRSVLAQHWPNAERFTDVRTVGAANLAPVDVICGGFPCQDVSSAGKRAGLAGARSGLWYEFARIVGELRPSIVIVENVASGASKWVDAVRGDLEQLGYESLPVPLSAADVGAPHERSRIFIVAYANSVQLRHQQRGGGRPGWTGQVLPRILRQAGGCCAGHSNRDRKPIVTEHAAVAELPGLAADPSGWAAPPEFRRVDDGLPVRLDAIDRAADEAKQGTR